MSQTATRVGRRVAVEWQSWGYLSYRRRAPVHPWLRRGDDWLGQERLLVRVGEAALLAGIPTVMIDVKGDLPNLLLNFPSFSPEVLLPWLDTEGLNNDAIAELARKTAHTREESLKKWGFGLEDLVRYSRQTQVRVITPGSTMGEPLHILSSLERRNPLWDSDPDAACASLSAAVSLVLRLVGRNPDRAKSRDHVLLSILARRRHQLGHSAELGLLLEDLATPPIERVGAQALDDFMDVSDRRSLAAALNTLLAAPSFANWRTGASLNPGDWLATRGRPHPSGSRECRPPRRRRTYARARRDLRRAALLHAQFIRYQPFARTVHGGRMRRHVATPPEQSAHQTAPRKPDETRPCLWRGFARRHSKPNGSGLPRALERRLLGSRAVTNRCRPRAHRREPNQPARGRVHAERTRSHDS